MSCCCSFAGTRVCYDCRAVKLVAGPVFRSIAEDDWVRFLVPTPIIKEGEPVEGTGKYQGALWASGSGGSE